jgi:endoglucanase
MRYKPAALLLSLFLVAAGCGELAVPTLPDSSASGATLPSRVAASDAALGRVLANTDFDVVYVATNQWTGGFQGELRLTNRATTPLHDWVLTFDLPASIQSVWNARRLSVTGSRYRLGAESYNRNLEPGQTVSIGFVASGTAATPGAFALEDASTAPSPSPTATATATPAGLRAEFRRDSDWGSGMVGTVGVVNGGTAAANGWRVRASFQGRIDNVWNAVVLEQGTDFIVFGPSTHNSSIAAGQRVEFGFQASPSSVPGPWVVTTSTTESPSPSPSPSPTTTPTPQPAPAGYLRTQGARLVDSAGKTVLLRGVNWFGMETSTLAPHGLWTRSLDSMLDQMTALGYNCIRLPFSNAVLRGTAQPNGIDFGQNPQLQGRSALEIMDAVVAGAGRRGMKVILDRHRPDPNSQSELWYSPSCSEAQWLADWETLARRYRDNPTVVGCDLHNEPHGPATWGDGKSATDWRLAAERAGNRILAVNPNLLIVVEGIEQGYWWDGNLKGAAQHPVRLNVAGRLVYSAHDYATSVFPQPWFSNGSFPQNLPGLWDEHWGYLVKSGTAPVLLGEFGSTLQSETDRKWLQTLAQYLHSNQLSFTYWSWNPNSADTGGILQDDWKTVDARKQDVLQPLLTP